jgi:hypothetical protein
MDHAFGALPYREYDSDLKGHSFSHAERFVSGHGFSHAETTTQPRRL